MKFKNYSISIPTDLSANQVSVSEDLSQDVGFSAQVQFTGTALNGTFKIQATNVEDSHWTEISGTSQTVTGLTGNQSLIWNLDAIYYNYIRISWTNSSGTGTINHCRVTVKG